MSLARTLFLAGALLMLTAAITLVFTRLGLRPGRLPGDLAWHGRGWRLSFPLATCLLLSIVLSFLLRFLPWVVERLKR